MKIKVSKPGINWSKVREVFILILFFSILSVGAFGWGIIYESRRNHGLQREVYSQNRKIENIDGRLVVIEGKRK